MDMLDDKACKKEPMKILFEAIYTTQHNITYIVLLMIIFHGRHVKVVEKINLVVMELSLFRYPNFEVKYV